MRRVNPTAHCLLGILLLLGLHAPAGFDKREVMIAMRDGVKLFTVIVVPKGARNAPILLTRTPYSATRRTSRSKSRQMLSVLPKGDDVFVKGGYIRVFQDVRGAYRSEGEYVKTKPIRGPLNATATDHSTDAYDTIEWLVKNTPESNGRVGMIGSSYEGFTVVMALLDPHSALKVAAPESPMVDGWMGDDWFHYGAFRQISLSDYSGSAPPKRQIRPDTADDYADFLEDVSARGYARHHSLDERSWNRTLFRHPAYDAFWQGQALDKLLAKRPSRVPTMWIHGLFDQEDMWGAIHCYLALRQAGQGDNNYLVAGPWAHGQVNADGKGLGPLQWGTDTALDFRQNVLLPFFDRYLKPGFPVEEPPHALMYNTGDKRWERMKTWPAVCEAGCATGLTPVYMQAGFGLAFSKPTEIRGAADSYISDPAQPVPHLPRPVRLDDAERWRQWLASDQRSVTGHRSDVLTYRTPPLARMVKVSGFPVADLFAATSGTDSDWVVKLIDVFPDDASASGQTGGYQLAVSMDIFRGRYRRSFEHPSAIPRNEPQQYRFIMPAVNHVFRPGHRIVVQIQSSWFPLYDRNPQTFVPTIFSANPSDYVKARQTIFRGVSMESAVWLPVVPIKAPSGRTQL